MIWFFIKYYLRIIGNEYWRRASFRVRKIVLEFNIRGCKFIAWWPKWWWKCIKGKFRLKWRLKSKYSLLYQGFLLSVALIMKTVIGVGIISLPYTLSRFGYIFGILIFILVGILSQMSSLLLIKAKNLSRRSNYPTILYHIYPTSMSKAFGNMTIILANVGMCK